MNHFPTYRSPIRLLAELGLDSSDINLEDLKSERKRLLLELQISENQTVTIGNKSHSKNDLIELFDELSAISNLDYHRVIFDEPTLLNLLENSKIEGTINDQLETQFESAEEYRNFAKFISPFLANSIDKALTEIIRNHTYLKLKESTGIYQMLSQSDGIYAFRKFNAFCLSLQDRVESTQLDASIFPENELLFIRYYPFYDAVNSVNGFYPEIADKVARAIVDFTVRFQKSEGRADHLSKISNHLLILECSEFSKAHIRKNDEILKRHEEQYKPVNKAVPIIVLMVALFIAIVVFLALKFGGPNESNQDSVDPIEELRNELDAFRQTEDSI